MRVLKNILRQLHTFVLWALASALLWSWIFTFVTDTSPDRKVTVYCYVDEIRDTELACALERTMPEGLKMIKVHSFRYVMFNIDSIENGDIFVVPASVIGEYDELFTDVNGQYGVKIYDAASHTGAAAEYLGYGDEDYYLFLGANSPHLEDGKALAVAMDILKN